MPGLNSALLRALESHPDDGKQTHQKYPDDDLCPDGHAVTRGWRFSHEFLPDLFTTKLFLKIWILDNDEILSFATVHLSGKIHSVCAALLPFSRCIDPGLAALLS